MDRWGELSRKEQELIEEENDLLLEDRKLQLVKEAYDEHFYIAKRFMNELGDTFHKNDDRFKYEEMINEFLGESEKAREHLEESVQDLRKQEGSLRQVIEDVAYEKKKTLLVEKEKRHEY